MDSATWGFIGVLVGSLIGAAASIVTTAINNWNASRLQKNSNDFERQELARAFQRDNLLKLQDALQDSVRFASQAHFEDQKEYLKNGEWGKAMLSISIDENLLESNRKLSILTERIESNELRSEIKKFRHKVTDSLSTKSQSEAKAIIADIATSFPVLIEKLGETLRRNY